MTGLESFTSYPGVLQAKANEKRIEFCTNSLDVLQSMSKTNLTKHRRNYLPVFNVKENIEKILDPTLEPNFLKKISHLTYFYA